MIFLIISLFVIFIIFYKRYFPILGVPCIALQDIDLENIKVIDVRDFNESYNKPIKDATNIPIAYLRRNINEVPNSDLHLIVSNALEKNVGIRFLRKKGFRVTGYSNMDNSKSTLKGNLLKMNS